MDKETIKKAKKLLKDQFGDALAKKATDEFTLNATGMSSQPIMRSFHRSFGAESFSREAPSPATTHSGVIMEFKEEPLIKKHNPVDNSTFDKKIAELFADISKTGEFKVSFQEIWRQKTMKSYREKIIKRIHPFNALLERNIERTFAQTMSSLQQQDYLTKICWINQTVRTIAEPASLSEIAADPLITKFDVPRKLIREINQTGKLVFATQYHQKFSQTGKGVIAAVIDSEIAPNHKAFGNRIVHKTNYTKEPWGNPDSHATAVAGIIGSNDETYIGMAPDATIYNYKVLATKDSLNTDDFNASIAIQEALEDGAHLANCSWGHGPAGDGTSREARACNTAWDLGLTIIKSAGNQGPSSNTLTTPADARGVIVVGATGRDGKKVESYSSRGPISSGESRPHLVAPGGSPAKGIFSCLPGGGFDDVGYGTSYAAPHVTGLLALILEANQSLSPDEQKNFVIKLCSRLNGFGLNDQGEGIISLVSLVQG